MKIDRTEFDAQLDALIELIRSMSAFEAKYHMLSETFFNQYSSGALEDSDDFVAWAGMYRHYIEMRQEVEGLLKHAA
jgi:hypothetical protein